MAHTTFALVILTACLSSAIAAPAGGLSCRAEFLIGVGCGQLCGQGEFRGPHCQCRTCPQASGDLGVFGQKLRRCLVQVLKVCPAKPEAPKQEPASDLQPQQTKTGEIPKPSGDSNTQGNASSQHPAFSSPALSPHPVADASAVNRSTIERSTHLPLTKWIGLAAALAIIIATAVVALAVWVKQFQRRKGDKQTKNNSSTVGTEEDSSTGSLLAQGSSTDSSRDRVFSEAANLESPGQH